MFPKSGFISLFKDANNESVNTHNFHEDLAAEWEIMECTDSESEQENKQEFESSSLQIEHFSSEENTLDPNESYATPARSKQPYHNVRSAKKKPLPNIGVKHKSTYNYSKVSLRDASSSRKGLSLKNNYTKQPSALKCPRDLASPWHKIKKNFAPMRRKDKALGETLHDSTGFTHESEACIKNSTHNVIDTEKIDWSFSSSDSETTAHSSQNIEVSSSQNATAPPTDLDLLIALIERENSQDKKQLTKNNLKKRRLRKGGYVQELQQTLDTAIAHAKYLETEKQLGLQSGITLRILQLESLFGSHYAKVQVENDETKIFRVALYADMAERAKVDSTLEAFFDIDNMNEAYLGVTDEPIFLQPHNLLLL